MLRNACFLLALLLGVASPAWAQLGPEIARKHAARAGKKLAELKSLYAEGRTYIGSETVPFKTWAMRPNLLRVESQAGGRKLVQCFDGVREPWLSHWALKQGAPQRMTQEDLLEFTGNADFEGALVNPEAKGYSVDYAGEEDVEDRRAYKLLVMSRHDEVFFYWVDTRSFEVVKRSVFRVIDGQRTAVETFFKDYRPVGGVMQPHRIETRAGGKTLHVTVIDKMEANPRKWPKDLFAAPEGWPDLKKPDEVVAEALEKQLARDEG